MARPTGVVRVVAITIAAMLAWPAFAAPPAPSGSQRFSGWTATCDNLGACVAIATAETDLFYLRIARDAGATAAPEIKMVLASPRTLTGGSPAFRLQVMNESRATPLGSFPARPVADVADAYEATVEAGAPSLAALAALHDAATLDYAILDAKGTLALKGLAAALRWIDVRQGRLGTPTALTARGMTPIGQVPPPREPPVVHRAAPGTVTRIETPVVSHDLLRRVRALEDCDAAVVAAHKRVEAWRLGPNLVLVAVPCVEGAYNLTRALYYTDAQGGLPRPVPLPQPRVDDVATAENVVTNMHFDATTLELSDDAKGRGLGDCGETRTFVWTGEIFALVSATGLDACPGALPRDWPRLYAAEVR